MTGRNTMQQGIICPTHYLRKFAIFSEYHLVLAHMVENSEDYGSFYGGLSSKHFRTLDNSSFEIGDDVYSEGDLVSLAKIVNANEIMAPESFENGEETALKILDFRSKVPEDIRVFGTIHGRTVEEITKCFLDVYKFVSTIGFSCRLDFEGDEHFNDLVTVFKLGFPYYNKTVERSFKRFHIVKSILREVEKRGLDISHLDFHLLGLNSPLEVSWYTGELRSFDSSCAYISGRNGVSLVDSSRDYIKPKDGVKFDEKSLSRSDEFRVMSNISFLYSAMNSFIKGV